MDVPWSYLVAGFILLLGLMAGVELGVAWLRRATSSSSSGGSDAD